jgi:[acyl-carrier-protein] S-malonyltransferase
MLTAFIFPAFVSEYAGNEPEMVRNHPDVFEDLMLKASAHLSVDFTKFDIIRNNLQDHELNTQYISYIFSCAIAEILNKKKVNPDYLAGYSMGLYAALYCGNAINFLQGLDLISLAYRLIKESTAHTSTGMASIVGLSKEDILELLRGKNDLIIANTNSSHSFLLSGSKPEIFEIIGQAKAEGALHASLMKVTCPYHNSVLNKASENFREYIEGKFPLKNSRFAIVSGIDQRTFTSKNEIKIELTCNLNTQINWLKTMEKMMELKVSRFIECGAGTSLYRIGKFIKGNFKIYPLTSIDLIIGENISKYRSPVSCLMFLFSLYDVLSFLYQP